MGDLPPITSVTAEKEACPIVPWISGAYRPRAAPLGAPNCCGITAAVPDCTICPGIPPCRPTKFVLPERPRPTPVQSRLGPPPPTPPPPSNTGLTGVTQPPSQPGFPHPPPAPPPSPV